MNKTKNYPFITWAARNWMLLLAQFITNWVCLTEHHFPFLGKWVFDEQQGGIWVPQTPMEFGGPLLWAIPFGLAVYLLTGLMIHLYYRQTIDADIHSGRYLSDWQALEPYSRLYLTALIRIGIFIGLCLLCAGLARA